MERFNVSNIRKQKWNFANFKNMLKIHLSSPNFRKLEAFKFGLRRVNGTTISQKLNEDDTGPFLRWTAFDGIDRCMQNVYTFNLIQFTKINRGRYAVRVWDMGGINTLTAVDLILTYKCSFQWMHIKIMWEILILFFFWRSSWIRDAFTTLAILNKIGL